MHPETQPRVLIVDDAPANIDLLMTTLMDEYAILVAKNGENALRQAFKEPGPDIILLDIMMPGMDGYEVCRRLKADPRTRDIPVLFITALSDEEDEARGLALGAVDYVAKPFRPALVKIRIRNQLELKRHRDHLEEQVRERTRELALTREATIESLATLAEFRDSETGGHIKRTRAYVRLLAEQLRHHPRFADLRDPDVIEQLHLSAPLHDVGKVGVPDAILLKPGKLTEAEFAEMQKHTLYGRDCIAQAEQSLGRNSFLRLAREIAYSHHERWDGGGYPQGLRGEAIPVGARIMAIADVYDALISRRVYKSPLSHAKAVMIIQDSRETHFDPDIVDAFLVLREQFRFIALQYADSEAERAALGQPDGEEAGGRF